MIEMLCGDKARDRISQKFEAFVVQPGEVGVLVEVGAVRQRTLKERFVVKDKAGAGDFPIQRGSYQA